MGTKLPQKMPKGTDHAGPSSPAPPPKSEAKPPEVPAAQDDVGVINPVHPDRPRFGFSPMGGVTIKEFKL